MYTIPPIVILIMYSVLPILYCKDQSVQYTLLHPISHSNPSIPPLHIHTTFKLAVNQLTFTASLNRDLVSSNLCSIVLGIEQS